MVRGRRGAKAGDNLGRMESIIGEIGCHIGPFRS